jgi:hypothetical protein
MESDGAMSGPERPESTIDNGSLNDKPLPNYKPLSLRLPFLVLLGVYICTLFAFLEFGFHTLPISQTDATVPDHEPSVSGYIETAYISGNLFGRRQVSPSTLQSLPVAQATPKWERRVWNTSGIANNPLSWSSSNEINLGVATTSGVAAPTRLTAVPKPKPPTNGNIVTFANRPGMLWSDLMDAKLFPNSTNRTNPRLSIREPHPENYLEPATLRRVEFYYESGLPNFGEEITISVDVFPSIPPIPPILGFFDASTITYANYSLSTSDYLEHYFPAACYGPTLIFLTKEGWDAWQLFSTLEKRTREGNSCWVPTEYALAQRCPGFDNSNGNILHGDLLPNHNIATETGEYIHKHCHQPTPTIATGPRVEYTRYDSKGMPTATIDQVTLQDPNGVPTEVIERGLDSDGVATTTRRLALASLQDTNGIPTTTATFELVTLRDADGQPTAMRWLRLSTLRDDNGFPTATTALAMGQITEPPSGVPTDSKGPPIATIGAAGSAATFNPEEVTLTDSYDLPVATLGANGGPVPADFLDLGVATLVDSNGVATATITASPGPESSPPLDPGDASYFHPVSQTEYIVGYFIPVLLGLFLSMLAQIINLDVKTLVPFQPLTRPGGATAADSLGMDVGGIRGISNS